MVQGDSFLGAIEPHQSLVKLSKAQHGTRVAATQLRALKATPPSRLTELSANLGVAGERPAGFQRSGAHLVVFRFAGWEPNNVGGWTHQNDSYSVGFPLKTNQRELPKERQTHVEEKKKGALV